MGPEGNKSKRYFTGTHRLRPPEETWEWIAPRLARVGITRVADVTGLDMLGVPVYQAVRPTSRNLAVSQGKGLTRAAARVSAVMESIELWHAESVAHLPQVDATLAEMGYSNPITFEDLRWMKGTVALASLPLRWIELGSLTRSRSGWLPVDMVELDFKAPEFLEPEMFIRSSNGLASGNDLDEAILHGLCESVERHAWQMARVDRHRFRALDPDSITPEALRGVMESFRSAGLRLAIYDMTCEIGLPVVFVRLVSRDLPVVWHGAGCHVSADVALSRALTEAAQGRLTYITGARDDLIGLRNFQDSTRAYRGFREPEPVTRFEALPDLATGTVADDVNVVLTRLDELGYEPFLLDLTRPDIGIPVALTFVPGFREIRG